MRITYVVCVFVTVFGKAQSDDVTGVLHPKFSSLEHYAAFCMDGVARGFKAAACPGGVSLLRKPVAKETCFCHEGHFIGRSPLTKDESTLTWAVPSGLNSRCIRYSVANNNIFTGDIYGLVPTLKNHVGDFDEEGNFRRVSADWLRNHGNWTPYSKEHMGNRKLGESSVTFWSHPRLEGEKSHLSVYHKDGSFDNCHTQFSHMTMAKDVPKPLATCKICKKIRTNGITCNFLSATSDISLAKNRNIDDTWTMQNDEVGFTTPGGSAAESSLQTYEGCNPPPKDECVQKPDSWVTRPLWTDWGQLTIHNLHDRLRSEVEQLVEYRMRRELQYAHIKTPVDNYPKALKLLSTVTKIFGKVANGLLNAEVLNTNFRLAEYLYFDTGEGDILKKNEFELITFALEKCLLHVQSLPQAFIGCPATPGQERNDVSANGKNLELPEGRAFNPEENDMIVELLWKGVDIVHSVCFPYFTIDKNSHDLFSLAMEKFFLQDAIQYRWFRNLSERQRKVYPAILPGLNEGTLEMADMVLYANFQNNSQLVYNNWLRKPRKQKEDGKESPKEMVSGCPKSQVIWDGEACCHGYDHDRGIFPPLTKVAPF